MGAGKNVRIQIPIFRPALVMIGAWTLFPLFSIWLSDSIDIWDGTPVRDDKFYAPVSGYFMLAYLLFLFFLRFYETGNVVLFEMAWTCNVGLLLSAIGAITGRPRVVALAMSNVLCDQLLWYVDMAGFAFCRKFPIGVARYLTWPDTSWVKKATCHHHLWYLPVCLYVVGPIWPNWTFTASVVVVSLLSVYARAVTPFMIEVPDKEVYAWSPVFQPIKKNKSVPPTSPTGSAAVPVLVHDGKAEYAAPGESTVTPAAEPDTSKLLYLNVNCGYEFWKDAHFSAAHIYDGRAPAVYLSYLIALGVMLNGVPYFLVTALLRTFYAS